MILKCVYFVFVASTLVVLLPGVWCDVGDPCIVNDLSNCTSSDTNQTAYACIDGYCTLRSGYDAACNETQPCLASQTCSGDRCGCNITEFYSISTEACVKKPGYGENCTATSDNCNLANGSFQTLFFDSTPKRSGYNAACNETQPCLASQTCSGDRCGCNITEFYSISTEACVKRSGYNETCNETQPCFASQTCLGDKCRCNATEYYNMSSQECEKQPGYGENCNAISDNCKVANGSCFSNSSTCRCNEDFYTDNNQCEPVSALQPRGFVVSNTTANSITLSWGVPSIDAIKEFIIRGYGSNFNDTKSNGAIRAITIPGLRPGTRYYNLTVTAIVNTDRGEKPVMSEDISDTTNPGKTGKIISKKINKMALEISFSPPSKGDVDYYLVYVSSNSMVINVSTPNVTLNASTLEPGQSYSIDITTYYNNKSGEVSMQNFTIPSGYGENCTLSPDSCTVSNNSSCYNDSNSNSTNCRCKDRFYTDNNQCKSVSALQPRDFRVNDTTAKSMTLSWSVPSNNAIKEFIISGNGRNKTINKTDKTTTIEDLQPGTGYNFEVTAIVNTDRGEIHVKSENTINDTTKPGKAGPLSPSNVYDTSKTMNISFEPPQYGVDEYQVKISGRGLKDDIIQTVNIAIITIYPSTLLPDTQYTITITTYYNNKAGQVSEDKFKTMAVPPETPVVAIVVSILVILLMILIIIGVVIWYRRRRTQHKAEDNISMSEVITATNPIKLEDFSFQLERMRKDDGLLFMCQFEDVTECSPRYPTEAAKLEQNGPKNRYMDILPYIRSSHFHVDKTRVTLTPLDEDKTTDYINANFIRGYTFDTEYIAAQGPLAETVDTFWRMIWEHNVPIIVMLSNFEEDGKPKVCRYYNDNDNPTQYGSISVKLQQKSNIYVTGNPENTFQIQTFEIRKDNEERTVRHFFLPGWVDFGANLEPADVLEFIQRVRQEINPVPQRPLLVHCSAGVGRTGTFIALDILQQHINRLSMTQEIDIPDLVLRLRCCRCRMVQSLKQYMFIHYAVNEIIENKLGNRTNHASGSPSLNGQRTQYHRVDNGLPKHDQNTDSLDNVKTEDLKKEKSNEQEKPSEKEVTIENPSDQGVTTESPKELEVTTSEKDDKQEEETLSRTGNKDVKRISGVNGKSNESCTLPDQPKVTYINIGDRVSLITKSTDNARNNDSSVADNHFHENPTFVAEDDIELNMETETPGSGI